MNSETLHSAFASFKHDYESNDIIGHLDALLAAFKQLTAANNDQNSAAFRNALNTLNDALQQSELNDISEYRLNIFKNLSLNDYIGNSLFKQIMNILSKDSILLSESFNDLKSLFDLVKVRYNTIDSIIEGFGEFDIQKDDLPPGDVNIILTFPEHYLKGEIDKMEKELDYFSKFFKNIKEISGENLKSMQYRRIGSSDLIFVLIGSLIFAEVLLRVVEKVIDIRSKYLKMKKIKQDVDELEAPKELNEKMDEWEKDFKSKCYEDVAKEIVDYYQANKQPRKNELQNHLIKQIKNLDEKLNNGIRIEIEIGFPSEAEDIGEEDLHSHVVKELDSRITNRKQLAEWLNDRGRSIARLEASKKEIPELTAPLEDKEEENVDESLPQEN